MEDNGRWMRVLGCFFAGLAVGLGAIGTHLLESRLPGWFDDAPRRMEAWRSGVFWQAFHALALLVLAQSPLAQTRAGRAVGVLFAAGVLLFSGFMFAWVLSGLAPLVVPVPLGGTLLLAGWAIALMAAWRTGNNGPRGQSGAER